MSTTEIHVPHEFLPALVEAATLRIMTRVQESSHDMACRFAERDADDEIIARVVEPIDARAAFLRALDSSEPVPVSLVREHLDAALEGLRSDLHHGAHSEAESNAETLADTASVLRDLTAWSAEHEIVAVTT